MSDAVLRVWGIDWLVLLEAVGVWQLNLVLNRGPSSDGCVLRSGGFSLYFLGATLKHMEACLPWTVLKHWEVWPL